jgi:hypothetical protein
MIPLRIAIQWEEMIAHKDGINAHILYPAYRIRERIICGMLEEVERSLASVPSDWQVEVRLETTLVEAQHWISPGRVQLEEVDNGVILRCQTEDLPLMAAFFPASAFLSPCATLPNCAPFSASML